MKRISIDPRRFSINFAQEAFINTCSWYWWFYGAINYIQRTGSVASLPQYIQNVEISQNEIDQLIELGDSDRKIITDGVIERRKRQMWITK